jgi:hypothetical protein
VEHQTDIQGDPPYHPHVAHLLTRCSMLSLRLGEAWYVRSPIAVVIARLAVHPGIHRSVVAAEGTTESVDAYSTSSSGRSLR